MGIKHERIDEVDAKPQIDKKGKREKEEQELLLQKPHKRGSGIMGKISISPEVAEIVRREAGKPITPKPEAVPEKKIGFWAGLFRRK